MKREIFDRFRELVQIFHARSALTNYSCTEFVTPFTMPLYTLSASSSLKFYGYEILSQTFIVNAVHKVQDIQNVHAKVF
jgi:hypothetical protein